MDLRHFSLASFSRYFPPAVAKTYVVTFRSHNDDRPSKFIVVANDRKAAINMAWEHGGGDFQSRFDKSTAQGNERKGAADSVIVFGLIRPSLWLTPQCAQNRV